MKKIILLSIALILVGFLTVTAQNIVTVPEQLNRQNTSFDFPVFENPQLPILKNTKSGQDWWEPDTIHAFDRSSTERIRYVFKYNSQGLLEEQSRDQRWNDNPWENVWINFYTYTYDSNNNVLTQLIENSSLSTYTYDSNNNMLTCLRQVWSSNSWINSELTTYTYDSNNNILTELRQNWDSNRWLNDYQASYIYDSNNNLLTELTQNWKNNSWENVNQITYTYASNSNRLTGLFERWRNNAIESRYLQTYSYDSNNNRLTELHQVWENNAWKSFAKITYTYDSNNNMLTKLHQIPSSDFWKNDVQFLMTYDENNNCTSADFWWWLEESWQPGMEAVYHVALYYNNMQSVFDGAYHKIIASYKKVSDFTSIAKPPTTPDLNTISIYPNPTTGELKIDNGQLKILTIGVYDIFGKQLLIFNFQSSIFNSLDVSHLPVGIYFVQVTTDKGIVTKKIVKL